MNTLLVVTVAGCMNNFGSDHKGRLNEEQIIGRVSGRNPRVEEIQQLLKDAEFDPGSVDGVMGGQTRKVIKEFQEDKGLKPTGKIDSVTMAALNKAKEDLKEAAGTDSKDKLYSDQGVEARFEKTDLSSNTEERITQIQTALKKAGFYKGEVDGRLGPQTRKAIRAFQKENGLKPDSVVGLKTWEDLKEYLKN
ncbi:MAG TPA: peptidoglycan-binding protein [Candidatus Omnitrophota bacterium]|nr:peptidoglycan-binding protein [Candidatus Omnitrophota bacterium]